MRRLICIMCPNGCELTVEDGRVSGNRCPKGADYGLQETTDPRRILTMTMKAKGCEKPFAVKSAGTVPKDRIFACAELLREIRPDPPVRAGDVVVKNLLGLGVDIVATSDCPG